MDDPEHDPRAEAEDGEGDERVVEGAAAAEDPAAGRHRDRAPGRLEVMHAAENYCLKERIRYYVNNFALYTSSFYNT